jgi:O-Antigen ligase
MSGTNDIVNVEKIPREIVLLALTPAFMVLLPWDFGKDSTVYRDVLRANSLSATVVQFVFVLGAMTRGFKPLVAILALPPLVQVALLAIAIATSLTTAVVAVVPLTAALGVIKFWVHLLFGLAVLYLFTTWSLKQRTYVWPAIGVSIVLFCILWATNIVFYRPAGSDWARLVPTLTNIRWVGFYSLSVYCAGVALILQKSEDGGIKTAQLIAILFATLGMAIAFWTGTRAVVVAIFSATLVSSLILPLRSQLLKLLLVSTVLGLAVAAALPVVHHFYGIERMIGVSISPVPGTDVSSGRLTIWKDALDKIAHRPIFGWGIDQFRYSFSGAEYSVRQPHNGLLQLVFSTGLIGLICGAAIAASVARRIPSKIDEPYQFASVSYLVGAGTYGLYDGIFYFSYPIMVALVAAACLIAPMPSPAASDRSN